MKVSMLNSILALKIWRVKKGIRVDKDIAMSKTGILMLENEIREMESRGILIRSLQAPNYVGQWGTVFGTHIYET